MHTFEPGILGAVLVVAAGTAACAASGSAERDGEAASESSDSTEDRSPSEARAEASAEKTAAKLPNPPTAAKENDGETEGRDCAVEQQDWKQIDFRNATALHQTLMSESDAFASCLEVLPAGTKYYIAFRVEGGEVTGAEPAKLSQLETRRLDTSEREQMVECLESKIEERELTAEPADSPYDVTHPFCAP